MTGDIGINQRIPISILEMALVATLDGQATPEYFAELAQTEYEGQNRIKKAVSVMNRLTVRNPLMPFLCDIYVIFYLILLYCEFFFVPLYFERVSFVPCCPEDAGK